MSIALVEHTGPWTPDDVEALPDLGVTRTTLTVHEHDLYSVESGGPAGYHTLTFKPASGGPLQAFAFTFGAGTR